MTRAASAAAPIAHLVSLALLGGACATAGIGTATDSDAGAAIGDTTSVPTESTQATTQAGTTRPATTQPATTRLSPAPPPPPDPPPAREERPPSTTTDASTAEPATTEAESEPSPANGPPDEEPAGGQDAATAGTESLVGEPYEYGPGEDTSLAVVGVPYELTVDLNDLPLGATIATLDASNPYEGLVIVREAPSGELLTSFDSWTGAIVATGRTRRLPDAAWPDAVWNEVQVAGLRGWARAAHLAPVGLTDDLTAHLIDRLGERPEADTLIELAFILGEAMASQEPPSRVQIVTRPIVFEALGEVTVDVLNLGDDSLLGYRLHVFAVPGADDWMSEDPGPFTLRTVERTILCQSHRGVTADGLCI